MYKADDIVPLLLEACPEAKTKWQKHLEWWGSRERSYYNDMSVFAHHIVDSYKAGELEEFDAFFQALEKLLAKGNKKVKDLVAIGIIEDIQNIASYEEGGYQVFEKWLKPLTKDAWREVEKIWEGKTSLADIIRLEKKKKKRKK